MSASQTTDVWRVQDQVGKSMNKTRWDKRQQDLFLNKQLKAYLVRHKKMRVWETVKIACIMDTDLELIIMGRKERTYILAYDDAVVEMLDY